MKSLLRIIVLAAGIGISARMPAAQAPRTFPDQRLATPVNNLPAGPYTRVHPWSELPYDAANYDNRTSVIGIAEGPDRNIYVLTRCHRNSCEGRPEAPIMKFDPEGKLLASFGAGLFAFPHNLTIDRAGNVWTTDEGNHAVRKFSADGKLLMTIGEPGKAGGPPSLLTSPTGVIVAPDGSVFVTEGHDNSPTAPVSRVSKWTAGGTFIKTWGKTGSAPGEFSSPHVIAMDSRGRLFVGDRNNNRIQIFDQEGNFLDLWYQFGRPSGIVITPDDRIYVADSESFDFHNPGWEKGIRIGSARDGSVEYFIRDIEPTTVSHSGAEGIGVDSRGNIYGGVVRRRMLEKFVRGTSPASPKAVPMPSGAAPVAGSLAVTAAIDVNAAMYHANLAAGQPGMDLLKLHTLHVLDILPSVVEAAGAIVLHVEHSMKMDKTSAAFRKQGPAITSSARTVAARAQEMRKLASQILAMREYDDAAPLVQRLRTLALTLDTEGLNPLEAAVYSILEAERLPRVLR